MSEKQGKVWGTTRPVFKGNNVEVHRAECEPGGYCSKHFHEHKYNRFFVEKGVLQVYVWKNDYDLVDETILFPGESITVAPGEFHQFMVNEIPVGEKCVFYEIYWTELDSRDIVRDSCGGIDG